MPKPKVFVTRIIPEAGLRLVREHCDAEVWPGEEPPGRDEIVRRAPELEGILALLTDRMDAELMDAAPKLRVISNYAVGYDNVDLAAASQRGIPVGNTPGVLTETTADLAFALLMSAARMVVAGADFVKAGKWRTWDPMLLRGRDIHHATLGLVGLGRIGTEMGKRGRGFDMKVIYTSRNRQPDVERELGFEYRDLDDLLREADFVSLHTPLTPVTRHLINKRTLDLMKPTAILINTSRGPAVDSDALYEALRERKIWAAGLDVTDPEPLPAGHKLLTLDNCLVVPHIGSASVGSRDAMALLAAENLVAGVEGRPLRASPNPEVPPRPRA
ncbi:MAG TPA: D-glycerate dehydrogenase [Chloroflexota bacterium]|jgi:lactate dehydrogenase-like 2-hydroxyacid dehydrogenase